MKTRYCIECNLNKATQKNFCDSCFNETKICRRCQKQKSIFEFEKNQKTILGKVSRRGECRDCRSWKKPMSAKDREKFEKIYPPPPIGKPFHCPICNRTIIRQYKNDVVLDHLHNTGKIRGWICRMCNNSMGMMEDDVNILERAIKWLKGTLK
ncbi:MAG: hypothetical protein US88_C0018G0008 [Parcubacteria group bacterium GW2011_GWA2_38_27]|nr:MAG: hypothetical protein US88_C0018G0008 [Parcubacteria group bacterium GW2011_GWA2_38_27]